MMEKMMKLVKDEGGQGMAEYGLILAGVAIAAMIALFALGPTISALFTEVNTQLQ